MLMTAYSTLQMDTETCNCRERGVSFGSCDPGQADWRRHDDPDIGLTGDCLPDVCLVSLLLVVVHNRIPFKLLLL